MLHFMQIAIIKLTDPAKIKFRDSIGFPFYVKESTGFTFVFIDDFYMSINNVLSVTILAN